MLIWTAPSIRSCFKNALPLLGDSNCFTLRAAKGEFVSMQILLRNAISSNVPEEYISRYVRGVKITQTAGGSFDVSSIRVQAQEYITFNDGITYPDPIANTVQAEVLATTTQSMWVTFPVPEMQEAGEYEFRIKFDCDDEDENTAVVILKVYHVSIPAANKGAFAIEHFHTPENQLMLDHGGYDCKVFDDKWWAFMEEFARSLRECRSNVYRIDPLQLLKYAGSRRVSKDQWQFDFRFFDKMTDLLLRTGTVKRFAIDDPLLPVKKRVIKALDYEGNIVTIDIAEPDAEAWAREYFSALYAHIVCGSDPNNWIMHIQDEPADPSTWIWARKLARKYMPGLVCGNPTHIKGLAEKLGDEADLHIPLFNFLEEELEQYDALIDNPAKEVWAYCCCAPSATWYLNRTIDRPAIYSRLIGWASYSRRLQGYLHYGYSWWQKTNQFYRFSINKHANYKGDCLMVYPSPEDNSYKISIRYINIRDGAQDYELFKLIEKTDHEKALALSRRVAVGFKSFDADEQHFMQARKELLELAERM